MSSLFSFLLYNTVTVCVSIWKSFEFLILRLFARTKTHPRHAREALGAYFQADFVYEDLSKSNSIRLLSMVPGSEYEPIACQIEEVSLDENPVYNALSYSWKSNTPWTSYGILGIYMVISVTTSLVVSLVLRYNLPSFGTEKLVSLVFRDRVFWISCNGKRMKVHQNLYDFLIQLRKSGNAQRIWIDALCVNQDDLRERNAQVKLMPSIYKSAQRVIAWLGTCPSLLDGERVMGQVSSGFSLSHLQKMSSKDAWWSKLGFPEPRMPILTAQLGLKVLARIHLLTRNYFERTWIIQEVLLSGHLTFWVGEYELQPEQLEKIVEMFGAPGTAESFMKPLCSMIMVSTTAVRKLLVDRIRYQTDPNWNLSDYITVARGHQASEARDLVFAGLGLTASTPKIQNSSPNIPRECVLLNYDENCLSDPDYSARVFDIFVSCTEKILQEDGLYALSLGNDGQSNSIGSVPARISKELPSWVPHFDGMTEPFNVQPGITFCAGGKMQARVRFTNERKLLQIESGAEHLDYVASTHKSLLTAKDIIRVMSSMPDTYEHTGESTVSALARTLVADYFNGLCPAASTVEESFVAFLQAAKKPQVDLLASVVQESWWATQFFRLLFKYDSVHREEQQRSSDARTTLHDDLDDILAKSGRLAITPGQNIVSPDVQHSVELEREAGIPGLSTAMESGLTQSDMKLSPMSNLTEPGFSVPEVANGGSKDVEDSTLMEKLLSSASVTDEPNFKTGSNSLTTAQPEPYSFTEFEPGRDYTLEEMFRLSGIKEGTNIDDAIKEAKQLQARLEADVERYRIEALKKLQRAREVLDGGIYTTYQKTFAAMDDMLSKPKDPKKIAKNDEDIGKRMSELLEGNVTQKHLTVRSTKLDLQKQPTTIEAQSQAIQALSEAIQAFGTQNKAVVDITNKLSFLHEGQAPWFRLVVPDTTEYAKVIAQRCENRCFFITEKGHIGLGSSALEKGDSIMILPGAYVPFAMSAERDLAGGKRFGEMDESRTEEERAREESTVVYRLKGEVYLHGAMYGERTESSDWNPKVIVLE